MQQQSSQNHLEFIKRKLRFRHSSPYYTCYTTTRISRVFLSLRYEHTQNASQHRQGKPSLIARQPPCILNFSRGCELFIPSRGTTTLIVATSAYYGASYVSRYVRKEEDENLARRLRLWITIGLTKAGEDEPAKTVRQIYASRSPRCLGAYFLPLGDHLPNVGKTNVSR